MASELHFNIIAIHIGDAGDSPVVYCTKSLIVPIPMLTTS